MSQEHGNQQDEDTAEVKEGLLFELTQEDDHAI
jgi:hypothetical protein